MKTKNLSSAEEIENMLTAHFSEFDLDNEVDADEDEDLEVESDEDENEESEEDILDESEDENEGEDDDTDSEDDSDGDDDDLEDEVTDGDDDENEGEDGDTDSEDDESNEDDESDDDELDEEDLEDVESDDDELDEDDLDVESDEDDDLEDIESVIASADDVVEALIASGAVAVIVPTATHDFQEVKAAFDQLDENDSEVDEDEDLEDDENGNEDENDLDGESDEDEADSECNSDEDELEVDADEDEDLEVDSDDSEDDEDILDDSEDDNDSDLENDDDNNEDEDLENEEDDEEADASELDEERFHPVVDLESLAEASVEDVDLNLYVNGTDAWWNVTVAGIPAARISKEHLKPEVHAFFIQDDFARNLKEAIASEGLMPVLEGANAEFYATAYLQSELADQVRAEAEANASEEVTEKAAGLRDSFLDCVSIASAGLAKNYFPHLGSPLKAALFEELDEAGISGAEDIIEAAFAKAGVAHFEAITAKAVEIMDKSEDYREELREAVGAAGVITSDEEDTDEEEITASTTFAHSLATGSYRAAAPMKGSLGDRIQSRLSR
jgi:hypothetical protein